MSLRKVTQTQTDVGTWAASTTVGFDVERIGLITRIQATVEITPSATLQAANALDGLFRTLQNLTLKGGAHTYFTLPVEAGGQPRVLLHYLNQLDGFGVGHSKGSVTAPDHTYVPVNYVWHAGTRPRDRYGRDDPWDLSAFVPASQEQSLRCEWLTGPNTVMDATVTITSAVLRLTIHRVMGTQSEILQEMQRQGVLEILPEGATGMIPAWTSKVNSPTATHSDYSLEEDVPLGGWLKRIGILAQDATGTRPLRAADEVTGIRLKIVQTGETLIEAYTDGAFAGRLPLGTNLEIDDAVTDFNLHAPYGIFPVDLRPHGQGPLSREYGLDLTGELVSLQTGAVKLGFTITTNASGDDILILYERYEPYDKRLAPVN